ncbi:MAG: DUF1549 domain-containing protein, partial [Gemmata sp.]
MSALQTRCGTSLLLLACFGGAATASDDFEKHVRPLLVEKCQSCHGAEKAKGGLRLDSRAALLKGGDSGPVIVPGKPAESLLVKAVGYAGDLKMPPKGKLSDAEIALLSRWIEAGAVWPDSGIAPKPGAQFAVTDKHRNWWAFQPVKRPGVPKVAPQPTNPIDAFVRAKLDAAGLKPAAPADKRTLLRRVTFDLTGLPPTPDEVDAFLKDESPEAFAKVVDQLLASPAYGQRWARHWLDVARYADYHDGNPKARNPVCEPLEAWRYRDWVVQSLNRDLPFDQFIVHQIAGDLLPPPDGKQPYADGLVATTFLVNGAWDRGDADKEKMVSDMVDDQIDTVGKAFLGLTLGCARCHDHKFDPVSQRDYYALQGVFAGVNFAPRPLPRERTEESDREVARLRGQVQQHEERLAALRSKAAGQPNPAGKLRPAVNARMNEETFPAIQTKALRFTIRATNASEPCLDELEVYDPAGKNVALASTGAKPSASGTLPGHEIHKLEHVNDGQVGNNRSWISNTSGKGWVRIDFPAEVTVSKVVWGRDRHLQFQDRVATDYSIEVLQEGDTWREVASAADREKFGPEDPRAFLKRLSAEEASEGGRLFDHAADARRRIGELTEGLNAWLGTFSQPPEIRRLHRGDHTLPREVVPPGGLEVFGGLTLAPDEPEQQRRLKLANWLASRDNPLTARVMVNRIWHYIFGTGLVETPSDFGGNG